MDFNVEIRKKQLESIGDFIYKTKDQVFEIINSLGWTADKLTSTPRDVVSCAVDPGHVLSAANSKKHVEKCLWKHEGYTADDEPLQETRSERIQSIFIDDATKQKLFYDALLRNPNVKIGWLGPRPVPKTADRLIATFTPDERLEMHNYAVAIFKQQQQQQPNESDEQSFQEIDRYQKNLAKFREKHEYDKQPIYWKRYSNVLRNVIDSQMDMLKRSMRVESGSRSASRSRSRNRSHTHGRSRSRGASRRRSNRHLGYSRRSRSRTRSRSRNRSRSRSWSRSRSRSVSRQWGSRSGFRRRQHNFRFKRNQFNVRRNIHSYHYRRNNYHYRRYNSVSPQRSHSRSRSRSHSRSKSRSRTPSKSSRKGSTTSYSSLSSYHSASSLKKKDSKDTK